MNKMNNRLSKGNWDACAVIMTSMKCRASDLMLKLLGSDHVWIPRIGSRQRYYLLRGSIPALDMVECKLITVDLFSDYPSAHQGCPVVTPEFLDQLESPCPLHLLHSPRIILHVPYSRTGVGNEGGVQRRWQFERIEELRVTTAQP